MTSWPYTDCQRHSMLVWQRCPKTIFVGTPIFDMFVATAVADFNDGRSVILKIMIKLRLRIGDFNKQSSLKSDLYSELVKNGGRLDMQSGRIIVPTRIMKQGCFKVIYIYLRTYFIMFLCAYALVEILDNHVLNVRFLF